jgi:phthalate 4,5-dioxygenase
LHQDGVRPNGATETSEWTEGGQARNTADAHPLLEVEDRPYGFRYAAIREPLTGGDQFRHVRTTLFIAPFYACVAGLKGRGDWQAYAPMNDHECMAYVVHFSTEEPLSADYVRWWRSEWFHTRAGVDIDEDYNNLRTPSNMWKQDREAMELGKSFSGIAGIFNEDAAVIESMGPIVDRTKEHLGPTDLAVIRFRRLMLKATRLVEQGNEPIGVGVDIPWRTLDAKEGLVPNESRWQDVLSDGYPTTQD